MKTIIQKIFDWNKIANYGDMPLAKKELEISMLTEEVQELQEAMNNNDKIEQLDAIADIFFVLMWTAGKLGFTEEQIEQAVSEVTRSNYTKFQSSNNEFGYEVFKNESGKIIKPFTYEKPNLKPIVNE